MATIATELNSGWQCRQSDDTSEDAWLPVSNVPTTTHVVLQENGKIPDPFIDMNELAVRWVAEKSWTYKTVFPSPTNREPNTRTDLVFEGLDTFAAVTLNGHQILEADNMFLEYRVDVTPFLSKPTDEVAAPPNVLEIVFDSALLRGRELVKQHSHEHDFIAHQTESSRLPVRKAQCHWGWDWGPILITSGPWKRVLLETYVVRIDDVWFQGQVSEDLKVVEGNLFASTGSEEAKIGEASVVKLSLSLDGKTLFESDAHINKDGIATAVFRLEDPSLWYPRGYGRQCLYELQATLSTKGADPVSKSRFIGFRRCQLIQEPDEFGKSFYFRINNVDVFAGGSCWIPADCFLPRIGEGGYRKWMELMTEGNQIMTRIWGGGIYEDDSFYNACDSLGILVWQDFCFACASYPTYPSFLSQVEEEARFNVRRLRHHPSLAIWAGNNEDYQIQEKHGLEYDYEGDKDPQSWLKTSFPARYIYEYLLPQVVQEESPGAVYHPSSPWGDGKKTWDPTVGDIHQWDVWHGSMRRYQELPTMGGRFVSEFGMEAYPHVSTIVSAIATDPKHQYPGSMSMDYHNRAIDHERRLMTYVAENFRITSSSYDLATFTHLTQVMQSDAVGFAYRSWRRDWGQKGERKRKCGGVLVWQFNDTWPTMSWAVVDYFCVKKPAFYAIKRALKTLAVGVSRPFHEWTSGHVDPTGALKDSRFDLWVCSSRAEGDVKADVVVRAISIATGRDVMVPIKKEGIVVKANNTTEILRGTELPVSDSTGDPAPSTGLSTGPSSSSDLRAWDPYIIHASLLVDGQVVDTNTAWPHPIKYLDFSAARDVKVTLSPDQSPRGGGAAAVTLITVTAARPVHGFVFREIRDGPTFSDNGFDVVPGEEVVVEVNSGVVREETLRWTYIGAESGDMGFDG